MEPTSYCGASRGHVHCEHFVLNEDSLKLFQSDERDEITFWLDMKNCSGRYLTVVEFNGIFASIIHFSGTINSKTFLLVPKLEILNLANCKIAEVANNSFDVLNNFKSLDVRESTFPFEKNSFSNCTLNSIHLSDLEVKLENLSELKYLEEMTFTNCTFTIINKNTLSNFPVLKTLAFYSCQINKIDLSAFDNLQHLIELRFIECEIEFLDSNSFSKLTSLQYLSFQANNTKSDVNYDVFKKLPSLENIFFDLDIYKSLDFSHYSKLGTVRIGYGNDEKVDEELRNTVISILSEKNIPYELVFTGKVEVNMDEVQICG